MSPPTTAEPAPLTQQAWMKLITALVQPEFEPKMRRRFRRYAVYGEVKATWEWEGDQFKRTWDITEVSAEGLTAKSYEEFPQGIAVFLEINLNGTPIPSPARLVHCTQTLGGYKLGIHLAFATE